MADSVAFIFKTLLKVPVYIFIAFGIFNVFAFMFIYFKLLGFSYVVEQVVVENNYIPESQLTSMIQYGADIANIDMVEHVGIVIGPDTFIDCSATGTGATYVNMSDGSSSPTPPAGSALTRHQYGNSVTTGVCGRYVFVWPLDHNRVNGFSTATPDNTDLHTADTVALGTDPTRRFNAKDLDTGEYVAGGTNVGEQGYNNTNIVITYNVPGLKYYPDLL